MEHSVCMGKRYPCEDCDYQAVHKSSLTTHKTSVHIGNIYARNVFSRNIHVRNVITRLHIRAVSPYIRSQSIWLRNIHARNVITSYAL